MTLLCSFDSVAPSHSPGSRTPSSPILLQPVVQSQGGRWWEIRRRRPQLWPKFATPRQIRVLRAILEPVQSLSLSFFAGVTFRLPLVQRWHQTHVGGKISTSLHFFEILAPFIFHSFMFSLRLIQDKANCYGGKWIVRLRKGIADRCWENLILAMIGEQFMVGDEICGAVVSVRFQVRNTASPIEMVIFSWFYLFLLSRKTFYPYGIDLPMTTP